MYIEQGYKGLSEAWRYIIGILVVFIAWQLVGGIPLTAAALMEPGGMEAVISGDLDEIRRLLGPNPFLFFVFLTFAIGLGALLLWVKFVHKQSLTSLTTVRKRVDWKRVFFAFGVWALVSTFFIAVDIYFYPEDYEFNFKLGPFMILLAIVLVMIPLQTSMEEYFIRGYMLQGLGIMTKKRWFPMVFTTLLFGLLHIFNPEVGKLGYGVMVFYVGTGLFLGIVILMDDGLELALGFHAANNMTAALFVTSDWVAIQGPALFRDVSDPQLGWEVFIPVFVVFPLLLLLFAKKYGWSNWQERIFGTVLSEKEFLGPEMDQLPADDRSPTI
ncbi:lysostaphin resistance A-like protein [Maribacter sp. 2307ULW6-5]|uniref:CPBP family intramembrane glutamic endopeptidase n=1 Tax=Maribacter sp. 2307ULW6-5 TaxID=3386275 RepID=UPI0039BD901D